MDPATAARNQAAFRAYRLGLFGLIPLAGLVLGPAAVLLGVRAGRQGKGDPAFSGRGAAVAAVVLGTVDAIANWVGVTLMVLGLRSMGAL